MEEADDRDEDEEEEEEEEERQENEQLMTVREVGESREEEEAVDEEEEREEGATKTKVVYGGEGISFVKTTSTPSMLLSPLTCITPSVPSSVSSDVSMFSLMVTYIVCLLSSPQVISRLTTLYVLFSSESPVSRTVPSLMLIFSGSLCVGKRKRYND